MKNLIVIKDVLPKAYWQEVYNVIAHPDFPWVYSPEISLNIKDNPFKQNPEIVGTCGFSHALFAEGKSSPYWSLIKPMLFIMGQKSGVPALTKGVNTYRSKANLLTQLNGSNKDNFNLPHIDPAYFDKEGDNWIFLYYLNDSDTIRKRIMPKANTGILFRDNIFHASSNPITNRRRMNLNFNLLVD